LTYRPTASSSLVAIPKRLPERQPVSSVAAALPLEEGLEQQHTAVQVRLAEMLSGVWRAVGAKSARNVRAMASGSGSRALRSSSPVGSPAGPVVESVQLVVQPDGSVRGGPLPDMRLSEPPQAGGGGGGYYGGSSRGGGAGESSVVLSSSNAFIIRGSVELTPEGFIGQMALRQTYLDGLVTHWSGHFFVDGLAMQDSLAQQRQQPQPQQQQQALVFGGKWDGGAHGNFAARQVQA
jgi:hypothetical protein